jgi:adenosylhomocysteine nucleosidase
MPVELEGIISDFGAEQIEEKGLYRLYKGRYCGHEAVIACSGVGKVNAAACTQILIDRFKVDNVINMGVAGALEPTLHTLDVVIGSEVFYHDVSPVRVLEERYPFASVYKCDDILMSLAEKVCAQCSEVTGWRRGRIASGDCFVEDSKVKEDILSKGGVCCEMEGAAIGHVCFMNGVPFLILRSISDFADEQANMTYDRFEKLASLQSNRIVEGIIRAFG